MKRADGNGGAVSAVVGATFRLASAPLRHVAATPAAEQTLDELFAGPLPEIVGRSLGKHRVIERVAGAALEKTDVELDVKAVLESERAQRAVDELLASPAFAQILEHVAASPQLRAALAEQSASVASQAAANVQRRAAGLDTRIEAPPRRWFHRPAGSRAPYAGIVTRGLALAFDALLATVVYVVGAALVGLVASFVGELRPPWVAATIAGGAWFLLIAAYFVCFWTTVGQTPGMRMLGVRVLHGNAPPGVARSLVRLVGLALAIIPCFAGFLPALVDDRRRALPDLMAGTVVIHDPT
jgi:uncharacterized RDD family membrane protein YckC